MVNKNTKKIGFSKFKKLYTGFSVGTIIAAIILDMSIRLTPLFTGTQWWFEIDSNYIFYVYAAICTIATLSSAFISIIIGTLSTKILGLSLKKILGMVSGEFNISLIIRQSLITVVLSTLFLAVDFCNAMTTIIILLTLFFMENTVELWNVITKDSFVRPLIEQHISATSNKIQSKDIIFLLNSWFVQLKIAVSDDSDFEIDQYKELINLLMQKKYNKEYKDILTVFQRNVTDVSTVALGQLGLRRCTTLLNELFKNISPQDTGYFVTQTIIENFKSFQFCSEQQLASINCINDFFDFIDENTALENLETVISSYYFNIERNRIISKECFFDLAERYLTEICAFTGSCERVNYIFSKCILSIFKKSVLLNEDKPFRESLYCIIIKCLQTKNLYSFEKSFIYTIGNIFTALYFYAFREKETFTDSHREELQSLMNQVVKSKDNVHISLYRLIQENYKAIFYFLIEQATSEECYEGMFGYHPKGMGCKTVVWTRDSKLTLAFEFYCLFWYEFNLFPQYLNVVKDKINISEILSKFDAPTKAISTLARENILQLGAWLNADSYIDGRFAEANFDAINDLAIQQQGKNYTPAKVISLEETNKKLNRLLDRDKHSALNTELSTLDADEYQLESIFVFNNSQSAMDIARRVKNEIEKIISKHIKANFPLVEINFTPNGISEMLEALKKGKFTHYNFRYIDDLALTKEMRNSTEFLALEKIYDKMTALPYNQFHERFFTKDCPICYNVNIVNHEYRELSPIEIDDWLKNFKIADNKYKIQKAIYTKVEANHYLSEYFRRSVITIKIASNVHLITGLRICINLRK